MKRFLQISIVISLLLIGLAKAFLLYSDKTFSKEEIDRWFIPVTDEYGVRIVYQIEKDFFSPLENPPVPAGPWRGSKVVPINHRILARYPDILLKAMSKYPKDVIQNHLKAIFFSEEINADGFKYGGTYDPFRKIIYLVDNGGQSEKLAISNFHHEFSSLLLYSRSFYLNPWMEQNPRNFCYLSDVYKTWKELHNKIDLSAEAKSEDFKKGFVSVYGQTNFENDFNEYSAMIFTYPEKFKELMNRYPRVRAKFLIWLEFYREIDPIFTEKYLLGGP